MRLGVPFTRNQLNRTTIYLRGEGGAAGGTVKFDDFPVLGNEILKFHDLPGFQLPLRTLLLQQNLYMLLV